MKERIGRYDPQAFVAVDNLVRELRSLLQELAVLRFKGSAPSLRAATSQLADSYRPGAVPESSWDQLVTELLAQTGLISAQADDLVFNHDTIIEYLAACARATSSGSGRLGIRERWSLLTRAGSSESYALFVVALLRRRGTDLVGRPPAVLQVRKLLHARLVAALVHDGYRLMPETVIAATQCLSAIAARRANGIPDWLHEEIFEDDDCVMAAKALALIDKDRGLDLLFTLAADPKVEYFSLFDVLAETMRMEGLTDINSARAISVLYRFASAPGAVIQMKELTAVDSARAIPVLYKLASDPNADVASRHRMLIADLVQERDPELAAALLKTLAGDSSMDIDDRLNCIERMAETDRIGAIDALADVITDASSRQRDIISAYPLLCELNKPAAVAALSQVANDETRSAHARAMAATALYREGRPEGRRMLLEIATDQATPGFHRVYYFADFGEHGDRTSRLLALSRDSTLLDEWRVLAAEELLSCGRDEGIDALRAIEQDESVDRRLRRRLRISLFVYRWLARRADAAALRSDPKPAPEHSWKKYLLGDERLIRAQRPHIAALMKPFALLFCCLLAAGTLTVVFPQRLTLVVIWAAWGALLLRFGWRVAEWSSRYIVVTDIRLFVQSGVLTRTINMLPPNAVSDMYFERSLMGCALGYGKFSIACWIPGGLHLKYLARPEQLYSEMVSMAMPKESVRQA
jgi:hypothetical protein